MERRVRWKGSRAGYAENSSLHPFIVFRFVEGVLLILPPPFVYPPPPHVCMSTTVMLLWCACCGAYDNLLSAQTSKL